MKRSYKKYKSAYQPGPTANVHKAYPEFFLSKTPVPQKSQDAVNYWLINNLKELTKEKSLPSDGPACLFLLKCLYYSPFYPPDLTFEGIPLELTRLATSHKVAIFNSLDTSGRGGNRHLSWFFAVRSLNYNQDHLFGTRSYCLSTNLLSSVKKTHNDFRLDVSGLSTTEYPLQEMLTSTTAEKYVPTLRFPPRNGKFVELEFDHTKYFQHEDLNIAEKQIADISKIVLGEQNNILPTATTATDSIHLDKLQGKQIEAALSIGSKRVSIIIGKAGTGKSFTLETISKWLEEVGHNVYCISPFHKTVDRLRELGITKASTGSSWALRKMVLDKTVVHKSSECKESKEGEWCPECNDVLFMDEVGISNSYVISSAFYWLSMDPNRRLAFFGDHNQMPPISGGSPLFSLMQIYSESTVELDKILRVSDDKKALIDLAHNILEGDPTIPDSPCIKTLTSMDKVWDNYIIGESVILTHSNAEAKVINAFMHDRHLEEVKIAQGRNMDITKSGFKKFFTGQVVCATVGSHNGTIGTLGATKWIEIEEKVFRGGKCVINKVNTHVGEITRLRSGGQTADVPLNELEDGYARSEETDIALNDLEDGYGVTTNKAQGSEFNIVFIRIDGPGMGFYRNKRWLYTSATRAKEKLFFITSTLVDFDYYEKALTNACPDLTDTTMIYRYFNNPESVVEVCHDSWVPGVNPWESHDERLCIDTREEADIMNNTAKRHKSEGETSSNDTRQLMDSDYKKFIDMISPKDPLVFGETVV
jgi:hypothetical protein